jgi:fermentation-respiration switch protein FrsA (DUF1100 family)
MFPLLSFFKKFILRIYWPNIERIKDIKIPILFIVRTSDEITPPYMTDRLYDVART